MLFLKGLLVFVAFGFLAAAAGLVLYDIYLAFELDRLLRKSEPPAPDTRTGDAQSGEAGAVGGAGAGLPLLRATPRTAVPPRTVRGLRWNARWKTAAKFVLIAAVLALTGQSIVVCRTARRPAPASSTASGPAPCIQGRT